MGRYLWCTLCTAKSKIYAETGEGQRYIAGSMTCERICDQCGQPLHVDDIAVGVTFWRFDIAPDGIPIWEREFMDIDTWWIGEMKQ